jgi:hypothetical protein
MKGEEHANNMDDAEVQDVVETIDDNCQIWKVKLFAEDINELYHHVKEEKGSKVFRYSSKLEDQHRGGEIKCVKSFQKCQSKDESCNHEDCTRSIRVQHQLFRKYKKLAQVCERGSKNLNTI